MPSSSYDEMAAYLDTIQNGLPEEQQDALQKLYDRTSQSQDLNELNYLALGFFYAKQFDQAIQIYSYLVEQFPDDDLFRSNLSAVYTQTGDAKLALYHLQYVVDHSKDEEMRRSAAEQLAGLQEFWHQGELDRQLRLLQVDALRERIAAPSSATAGAVSTEAPTAEDYRMLADRYLRMESDPQPPATLEEETRLLEEGRAKFPDSAKILELLALCYARSDDARMNEVLSAIERLDPDSPVLKEVRGITDQEIDSHHRTMLERAYHLLEVVQSADANQQAAALKDLQEMVRLYPQNIDYRSVYGFALGVVGEFANAIRQAEILEASAGESHSTHFNIGQIFWGAGDEQRGRHHLDLAYQYASTDQERQDVLQQIAAFSGSKANGKG